MGWYPNAIVTLSAACAELPVQEGISSCRVGCVQVICGQASSSAFLQLHTEAGFAVTLKLVNKPFLGKKKDTPYNVCRKLIPRTQKRW